MKRSEASQKATALGAGVTESMSKNTDILVALLKKKLNERGTSAKRLREYLMRVIYIEMVRFIIIFF